MNPHSITVVDPAMCCSTGVCGPEVDPKLARSTPVQEAAQLQEVVERHAKRVFVVPWSADEPTGSGALRRPMTPASSALARSRAEPTTQGGHALEGTPGHE